jgi:hypothetical protein
MIFKLVQPRGLVTRNKMLPSMEHFAQSVTENTVANLFSTAISVAFGFLLARILDLSVQRTAFKRLFGKQPAQGGDLFVVLDTIRDTRLLGVAQQRAFNIQSPPPTPASARYWKYFGDKQFTTLPGPEEVVPECSARGSSYLIDSFRGIRTLSTKMVSDSSVQSLWTGTFIALGSSNLNVKTDHIKHLPENSWLNDDAWQFTFKNENTVIQAEGRNDKGLILKLPNPHSRGDSVIVCEGIGEWGTSGSAWFLSRHWKQLSRRFGDKPFLIVLNVTVGNDESAREILARGDELPQWSISRWI